MSDSRYRIAVVGLLSAIVVILALMYLSPHLQPASLGRATPAFGTPRFTPGTPYVLPSAAALDCDPLPSPLPDGWDAVDNLRWTLEHCRSPRP